MSEKSILVVLCLFEDPFGKIRRRYIDGLKLWIKWFPKIFRKQDRLVIYVEKKYRSLIKEENEWLIVKDLIIEDIKYEGYEDGYFKMMHRWRALWDFSSEDYVIVSRDIDSWPTKRDFQIITKLISKNVSPCYFYYPCIEYEGCGLVGGGSIVLNFNPSIRFKTVLTRYIRKWPVIVCCDEHFLHMICEGIDCKSPENERFRDEYMREFGLFDDKYGNWRSLDGEFVLPVLTESERIREREW